MSTIALVGNPNSGKTTLFNKITGLRQKVGNYPGVTVEKKQGVFQIDDHSYTLLDLPGTYSLYPKSADEKIVLDTCLDSNNVERPDLIIYVLDVNQLDKQMLLLTQIMDCYQNVVVFLNTMDGENLSEEDRIMFEDFFKCKTILSAARSSEAVPRLKEVIKDKANWTHRAPSFAKVKLDEASRVADITGLGSDYQNYLCVANIQQYNTANSEEKSKLYDYIHDHSVSPIHLQVDDVMRRYDQLDPMIRKLKRTDVRSHAITDRLDAVLSNNIWGYLIFVLTMLAVFQILFSLATYPMDWIDQAFSTLQINLSKTLPDQWWSHLLVDGIISGIGGIVVFVPQIFLLFFLLGILEDTGYMSRIVYLADGSMRKFGLNGRSVVSMISGAACAIPAVMSARTISNRNEKLLTILFTPFVSCSARLPVFVILISIIIPARRILGIFSSQALVLTGLYIAGILMALVGSWLFQFFLKTDEHSLLMLELPDYKFPNWQDILINAWSQVKTFITEAGKVILIISVLLWFGASYGPPKAMERVNNEISALQETGEYTEDEISTLTQTNKLEASYAGHFGKFIEPAIRPLGYDWKIGISLLTSFAAREVFVGTMSTIYSVGSDDAQKLTEKLKNVTRPDTGEKVFTLATGMSLLIFYLLAMQCMSTLAVVRKETGTWRWPLVQFLFMTGTAYLFSLITYQLLA